MSVLAWKPRTRLLLLSLLVVMLAAATVIVGGGQSAQAFDCTVGGQTPVSCPFVRIDQESTPYTVEGLLLDPGGDTLHRWSEDQPVFTLWHWRYEGNRDYVRLVITPKTGNREPKRFEFWASESRCIVVTQVDVYVSGGCNG